jgi:hypothetical protein
MGNSLSPPVFLRPGGPVRRRRVCLGRPGRPVSRFRGRRRVEIEAMPMEPGSQLDLSRAHAPSPIFSLLGAS